ncbi:SDR family oxidoreductase [Chroococcidiopsis sp. CCMEE 29]|uniref:NAD-dependent epimerase/dehydratase family protein n=1 Tax=Chroococcidiopsis sp. CCMEE 29 TaxID=155894 RepID=UPI002020AADF|nr:SDR family oxidoreductase [Chroococcidiopsis sp. CCMEE 29]
MKILVTGTEGYIGSLLTPFLMQRGHTVIGANTGFYSFDQLNKGAELTTKTLNTDIRQIDTEDLLDIEAIVYTGDLANAPTGQLYPTIAYDINYKGSVRLANIAKTAGVRRFIYMSSCSVYGIDTDDYVTEEFPVNPQSDYAIYKTLVEQDVKAIADDSFSPTFLRIAHAFGASPRMRFDSILNYLAGLAWTTKEIKVPSDGILWCPLVHALDVCKAILCTLEAPRDIVHNQTFNVGDTAHNYQVKEIAEIVAEVFKDCPLNFENKVFNQHSYRISFEKINKIMPGFKCEWTAQRGAQQLLSLFTLINPKDISFKHSIFQPFSVKQVKSKIKN